MCVCVCVQGGGEFYVGTLLAISYNQLLVENDNKILLYLRAIHFKYEITVHFHTVHYFWPQIQSFFQNWILDFPTDAFALKCYGVST